ncbi:hypothetical protein QUF74_10745 [Candidatus Halobeggiatoa sp. HSG11]|nr:hypothetical protein [Candidatus Halobeggiatoa sp. HSG11]
MKTQLTSILSSIILTLSIGSVQATETVEITPSVTDIDIQTEALPQEIADMFVAEVEIDGISLLAEQEMAESFGTRCHWRSRRCCRRR